MRSLDELSDLRFDLILLMGNGLGVLGNEDETVEGMSALVGSLNPGGKIIIETGNPFRSGYAAPQFTINFDGVDDGPFIWGHADRAWVTQTLQNLECSVKIQPSHAPGGIFFFAVGQRVE